MAEYKSFIVHLQRATGRKAQVQDLISKAPYVAQIVDAVDGSKLSKAEIDACYQLKSFMQPSYPFALNAGEIGCFLSHRKAWQQIVDQGLDGGLVFEDDVQIDPVVFEPALEAARSWSQDFGFIQFQVREVAPDRLVLRQIGGCKLLRPVPTLLRCSAQLVSNTMAKKLLKLTARFDRPVDTLLQMHWETGVRPVCVVPSGVTDRTAAVGGSTLSSKQPAFKKIGREFNRIWYRAQIRKYSKRTATEKT